MRWSRGQEFAVENLAMEPHAIARLAHYVKRTVQEPSEIILRVRTAPSSMAIVGFLVSVASWYFAAYTTRYMFSS